MNFFSNKKGNLWQYILFSTIFHFKKKGVLFYTWNACDEQEHKINVHFTLEDKANVQLKSSIPIGAKVEMSLKGSLH